MKMRANKKSLLVRMTAITLALGVAAMLLSGAVLYGIFHERASANMENTLNKQIDFMLYPLIKFQSLDWLLSYWQEHWQEMELPPFHDTDTYEKWSTERSEFYYLNITALTAEELREMSAQRQRYFAEYCYLEIMLALAMNRPHTDIDAVSCFIPNASGEGAFAVFLSTDARRSTRRPWRSVSRTTRLIPGPRFIVPRRTESSTQANIHGSVSITGPSSRSPRPCRR